MSHRADSLAERTYALVVGVEHYGAVSREWRLPGAAHDAHRFARWLTTCAQVPPANVRLFLSPLPGTTLPDTDDLPPHRPATEANIKHALLTDLPSRDGDVLWIYWAGHGFVNGIDDPILPYADASAASISNLNLGSALRHWRSDSVSTGRFRHQIALVDACRVEERRVPALRFEQTTFREGLRVGGREQFVLYATRPGEVAKNRQGSPAGLFTQALLERLDGLSLEESVGRLTDIAQSLQRDFDDRRRNGQARQTPTFEIHRGWHDSAVLTAPDADDTSPRLDQPAWDRLAALARQHPLPACAHDAYRWAFDVCRVSAPVGNALPEGGLTEIVRDLDDRMGRPELPLALPFVRYLAAHAPDRAWGARLDSWVEETRLRLRAAPVPPAPAPPQEPGALHVQLGRAPLEQDAYLVRIWRYRGRFTSEWESGGSLPLSSARGEVGRQIAQLVERFVEEDPEGIAPDIERVEFHIPHDLLDEDFENWSVPAGAEDSGEPVGVLFEVVVRCPDQRKGVARQKWRAKWRALERQGPGGWEAPGANASQPVWLLSGNEVPGNLSALLQAQDLPVCVLAAVERDRLGDVLKAVFSSGVPVAVWRRGEPSDGAPGDLTTALVPPGEPIDPRKLPGTVRALRIAAQHPVVLLWDDPNRRPDSGRLMS
ncbi:caspase family protein [Streptomyces sp. GXMU-J15]|uniref:Caspase family protein n=1 Tax=Streptomyces fuscus TaxID=3048495 RepID=A0ABT7J9W8_9ACTN|nr:caspase family protein [Streptomyces fuscus]MDL2080552.1 caspase family protein [Streptomyces fuscus]